MNVGELILALAKCDPALDVFMEGCDCINMVRGVEDYLTHSILLSLDARQPEVIEHDDGAATVQSEIQEAKEISRRFLDTIKPVG